MDYKVSVIIPVFRSEKFISRCANSLFNQSLLNVEFIFVNDCTPDKSIEILKNIIAKFPSLKNNIKIINHEVNMGVSCARQTGLNEANGEYIIFCDSDDYVERNWLLLLYNNAKDTFADLVSCDFFYEKGNQKTYSSQRPIPTTVERLKHGYTNDIMAVCWNKLIKAHIIKDNEIKFAPEINYMEDLLFNYEILSYCKKISHIDQALYNYNVLNEESLSRSTTSYRIYERFYVKYKLMKMEYDSKLRQKNALYLLKDQEIIELYTNPRVSNGQLKIFLGPFLSSIWKRKNLDIKWKIIIFSLFIGIGSFLRKKRLKCSVPL